MVFLAIIQNNADQCGFPFLYFYIFCVFFWPRQSAGQLWTNMLLPGDSSDASRCGCCIVCLPKPQPLRSHTSVPMLLAPIYFGPSNKVLLWWWIEPTFTNLVLSVVIFDLLSERSLVVVFFCRNNGNNIVVMFRTVMYKERCMMPVWCYLDRIRIYSIPRKLP